MSSPTETARDLVRAAAERATTVRTGDHLDVRFDARTLDQIDRFVRHGYDRFNMVTCAIESAVLGYIAEYKPEDGESDENVRITGAATAAALLMERHERPRGRLYRQGPNGLELLEA